MGMLTPDIRATEVDEGYTDFEKAVASRLGRQTGPLFTTDAERLWDHYLNSLPANRQHYNCRCCRNFIERFGGLVTITQSGDVESATWEPDAPDFFQEAVSYMRRVVLAAKVTGVFLTSEPILGTPKSPKGWTHLCSECPTGAAYKGTALLNADQRAAELREEYGLMRRTILEYEPEHVQNAVKILQSETFKDSEKAVGAAVWFRDLVVNINATKNLSKRDRIAWFAVATAPPGFAHLKNGMLGTLLNDLRAGKGFEECRRAWSEKMNPRKYRRPTAPVSAGHVENAERVVEKLGIQNSLKRRYAKLEELPRVFWRPQTVSDATPRPGGVFGHLLNAPPKPKEIAIPDQRMTFAKFRRDVLPNTRKLEVAVPSWGRFMGMMTAVDPAAPPIIQWDSPEARNPVSYYVYIDGSACADWKCMPGWSEVPLLCEAPHGDQFSHHENFIFVPIKGAGDRRRAGLALFPVILKQELRSIERTIEHFSNTGKPEGESEVGGLVIDKKSGVNLRVNGLDTYTIDRME
jgi:hypothetical protein